MKANRVTRETIRTCDGRVTTEKFILTPDSPMGWLMAGTVTRVELTHRYGDTVIYTKDEE